MIFFVILQPHVCVYSFETGSDKIPVYYLRINRYNHIWKHENLFK